MPLHSHNKVIGGIEFDGLNHAVGGRKGGDAQRSADLMDGLMMAGVDLWLGILVGWFECGEACAGCEPDRVRFGDEAAGGVVHCFAELGGQVLIEGAIAPDIEGLGAMADAEDGLVETEGILNHELIDGGASGVGRAAGWDTIFAKSLRVYIVAAAGEQDALSTGEHAGDTVLALMERDDDGGSTGGLKRGQIERQRALVVLHVGAGGLGDGDTDVHTGNSVRQVGWKKLLCCWVSI